MKIYVIECTKFHSHFIYDIYDNEENAKKALKMAEHDHRDYECHITAYEMASVAPVFTIDFNEVVYGKTKFKMKGSDHIFIAAEISPRDSAYDGALIDITNGIIYKIEEIDEGKTNFNFYTKPGVEDYWGVEPVEED